MHPAGRKRAGVYAVTAAHAWLIGAEGGGPPHVEGIQWQKAHQDLDRDKADDEQEGRRSKEDIRGVHRCEGIIEGQGGICQKRIFYIVVLLAG